MLEGSVTLSAVVTVKAWAQDMSAEGCIRHRSSFWVESFGLKIAFAVVKLLFGGRQIGSHAMRAPLSIVI